VSIESEAAIRTTDPPTTNPLATNPWDDDKLREECGVFGIFGRDDAAPHAALGLHALQHRGQEAAGIVSYDGEQFHAHRDLGYVGDIDRKSVV
jgi:amidophosphoribosyltransferase